MVAPTRRLLFEYAGALEGAFLPHVPAATSALIPAVTFKFNEEVRSAAALALAKVRDETYGMIQNRARWFQRLFFLLFVARIVEVNSTTESF